MRANIIGGSLSRREVDREHGNEENRRAHGQQSRAIRRADLTEEWGEQVARKHRHPQARDHTHDDHSHGLAEGVHSEPER
jgi:hypothetical protein